MGFDKFIFRWEIEPDLEQFQWIFPVFMYQGEHLAMLDPGTGVVWKTARERNLSIHFTLMLTPMLQDLPEARSHQGEILRHCAQLVETGKLTPRVESTLPLEEVARAHRAIEEGHVQCKIVLQLPEA